MQRLRVLVLSAAVVAGAASSVLAQADAQAAYQQAKTAYQAGKFTEARDLARKAAETDAKNPEVLLLLGKALYQLGDLDEAVAAWKQTLALAPEEPFATKMLQTLQARRTDVDTRIKLVEVMIAERLFAPAAEEARSLLANKATSDVQRARVMTLQADLAIRAGQPAEAQKILRELLVLYPKQADPVETTLLLGQAKLRAGGDATAEGVALLKSIVAGHAESAAAVTARYQLVLFDLGQGVDAARVGALAKWLAGNEKHPLANEARMKLIEAELAVTRQGPKPTPDSPLSPADVQAIAQIDAFVKQTLRADDAKNLAEQLVKHLDAHYAAGQAFAAAAKGAELLSAAPLPSAARMPVLKARARYKTELARKYLETEARSGRLPAAVKDEALPAPLAEAVAAYEAVRTEYPTETLWAEQASLASLARQMVPRDVVEQLNGPDAWAIAIALPVIKANGDPAAVKTAIELVQTIIRAYAAVDQPAARALAVAVSRRLVAAPVSPDCALWPAVMTGHAAMLDGYAKFLFSENIKAGRAEDNAKPSDVQKELLGALAALVARDAAQASVALKQLAEHVKPWIDEGHWAVAEDAYTTLAKSLPEAARWDAEQAIVNLWIQQAYGRDLRLAAAGLTVPRELDPSLKKALLRCYELQAGLPATSPKLAQVRAGWDSIVAHYRALEYDDIAEAAIKLKPEKAVEAADQYAAFQAIRFQEDLARRELARQLRQYGAAEKIALTPALKTALDAWTKFITDRPDSPLARQAVEQVLGIGRLFEEQSAFDVAAGVYRDFAKAASAVKVLAQAPPGGTSTAQRAAFAVVAALDGQARKVLAKVAADRKPDDPPPAKLSDEFAAVLAAAKVFVEANPDSPSVSPAIRTVMAVALEYAKIDAWEVAEGVYADLQQSKLKIRRPERLDFARGVCQLGRAMPAHAKEVLAALTSAGLGGPPEGREDGPTALAAAAIPEAPARPGPGAGPGPAPEPKATPAPVTVIAGTVTGNKFTGGALSLTGSGTLTSQPGADLAKFHPPTDESKRDTELLAMIQRQEATRSARVAELRVNQPFNVTVAQQAEGQQGQVDQQVRHAAPAPVLSEAELARLEKAFDAAYRIFQNIRKNYADTPTAQQARAEILVMVGHWRSVTQWQRSAALAVQYLADNPVDLQLAQLRLEVARDRLSWASKPIEKKMTKQEMLSEVSSRFAEARAELAKISADFPKERGYREEAQWDTANSFLTEARVVSAVSPTLARGQFVRAARELRALAAKYPNHPRIGTIPEMLWSISQELENRKYDEEAIVVWNELAIYDPLHPLTQQATLKIAQTYQRDLKRPLRAVEAYLELNFMRGGSDQPSQDAILQIGTSLKNAKRWVEALHVLETFVDSFPRHAQAGQALTMVGQIHQTNEAWKDAIAAYKRVMEEYKDAQWVQEAKWSIAECTINLSQWREAQAAYRDYAAAYPKDAKVAEANRRIEVLKDLARYQGLVDEEGQRKAFDAQFQIATIVRNQLANPVKSIIEYRKVVTKWPKSYVAANALYEIGTAYMGLGETAKAREALQAVARDYPTSPLAGAALFMVGKSYEEEADKLASVTREKSVEQARDVAQREAYQQAQGSRQKQEMVRSERVSSLKSAGKGKAAEVEEAAGAFNIGQFSAANTAVFAQKAAQEVETLTATQLADRQDKINAALRKAIDAYGAASKIAGSNKADASLLQMATIYDQRLKDSKAAMETWLEIVRQFSGTAVAEDASWKLAQYYEREGKYAEAIDAYNSFLRNYRRSPNAGPAQFAVAECYEHLGQWVAAMDSYNNYINNFADGPLVAKAKEQINWIKTYRL